MRLEMCGGQKLCDLNRWSRINPAGILRICWFCALLKRFLVSSILDYHKFSNHSILDISGLFTVTSITLIQPPPNSIGQWEGCDWILCFYTSKFWLTFLGEVRNNKVALKAACWRRNVGATFSFWVRFHDISKPFQIIKCGLCFPTCGCMMLVASVSSKASSEAGSFSFSFVSCVSHQNCYCSSFPASLSGWSNVADQPGQELRYVGEMAATKTLLLEAVTGLFKWKKVQHSILVARYFY